LAGDLMEENILVVGSLMQDDGDTFKDIIDKERLFFMGWNYISFGILISFVVFLLIFYTRT
jgi:hypothetical protein